MFARIRMSEEAVNIILAVMKPRKLDLVHLFAKDEIQVRRLSKLGNMQFQQ